MKINLDDPRTTLRIAPRLKKKASDIAQARNISLNQYIEELIERANVADDNSTLRDDIAELKEKTAQLDARLKDLQKKPSKK